MIGETYHIEESQDRLLFGFTSEGPQGKIVKFVVYQWKHDNVFSLGFGDYENGRVNPAIVSNNDDLVKVINTVASTIYLFLAMYPNSIIFFEPVDGKRSNLYHHILRRRYAEIQPLFVVRGLTEEGWEDFLPGKRYLAFELEKRKES